MAQLLPDGTAAAPADAPPQVQQAIFAANKIQDKPYKYGGGHAKVEDKGYDCSGTVSYALLAAAELGLEAPLDSGSFMKWGEAGEGQWITIYTNPGHAYAVIAGLRLDTSIGSSPRGADRKLAAQHKKAMERGPRWRPLGAVLPRASRSAIPSASSPTGTLGRTRPVRHTRKGGAVAGMSGRFSTVIKAKINKLLDKAEDPARRWSTATRSKWSCSRTSRRASPTSSPPRSVCSSSSRSSSSRS